MQLGRRVSQPRGPCTIADRIEVDTGTVVFDGHQNTIGPKCSAHANSAAGALPTRIANRGDLYAMGHRIAQQVEEGNKQSLDEAAVELKVATHEFRAYELSG